ncbi:MAG TPA: hypothetical protein PKJ07_06460 [Bacteroidales bacterium]|nr:hypothetical protein [Bacteroidales bacterium]HPU47474.1 hypothetical protein [Bacteroidales bacterium]HPZ36999.1 hypothetical protein [Bacteroidales bacterium]HXK91776.1 hypothetical protein [Bacteroidales bacterium]
MNNLFSKIIFLILSLYGNIIYSQCKLQEIYFNNDLSKKIYYNQFDKPVYIQDLQNKITEIYYYKDTLLTTKIIIFNTDTLKYYYSYNEKNKIEKIRTMHNTDLVSVAFYNYYDTLPFEIVEYTDSMRYLTRYSYDHLGRTKEISYAELSDTATIYSQNWIYNYDSNGNLIKKIQLRDNDTLCIWIYEYSNDHFLLKEKIQNNLDTTDALEKYFIYNNDGKIKEVLYVRNNLIIQKEQYKLRSNNTELKKIIKKDYSIRPIKNNVIKYKTIEIDCDWETGRL